MKAVVKMSFHEVYAFRGNKRLSTELRRNGKGDCEDLMKDGAGVGVRPWRIPEMAEL